MDLALTHLLVIFCFFLCCWDVVLGKCGVRLGIILHGSCRSFSVDGIYACSGVAGSAWGLHRVLALGQEILDCWVRIYLVGLLAMLLQVAVWFRLTCSLY